MCFNICLLKGDFYGKEIKKKWEEKKKITKSINKLKNKISLKEKKLAKVNIKIASIEKKNCWEKSKKTS